MLFVYMSMSDFIGQLLIIQIFTALIVIFKEKQT